MQPSTPAWAAVQALPARENLAVTNFAQASSPRKTVQLWRTYPKIFWILTKNSWSRLQWSNLSWNGYRELLPQLNAKASRLSIQEMCKPGFWVWSSLISGMLQLTLNPCHQGPTSKRRSRLWLSRLSSTFSREMSRMCSQLTLWPLKLTNYWIWIPKKLFWLPST